MKFAAGEQSEIPDDEPLDEEDLRRIGAQGLESRAALINRSAQKGLTPMELFARGEVEVLTPHDKLAFDKKRQLPAPPPPVPLEVKKSPPKSRVPRPPAPKSRVQEWLDNGGAEHFLAGFLNEPPPTKTGEAVPVDDDEIVEGEMLDSPVVTKDEEDVVDAEIVEESCPEE